MALQHVIIIGIGLIDSNAVDINDVIAYLCLMHDKMKYVIPKSSATLDIFWIIFVAVILTW